MMAKNRKAKDRYAYREKLPFTCRSRHVQNGRPYQAWWNVKPTGDYATDYNSGADHALTFWRVVGGRGVCGLDLGEIIFAMMEKCGDSPRLKKNRRGCRPRQYSGIEIGFIRTICELVALHMQLPDFLLRNQDHIKSADLTAKWKRPRVRRARIGAQLLTISVASRHTRDEAQQAKILEAGSAIH